MMPYDNNRANQLNMNHVKSGPGRPAGYHGLGTKADLDNHANQMNPRHPAYHSSRQGNNRASSDDVAPRSSDGGFNSNSFADFADGMADFADAIEGAMILVTGVSKLAGFISSFWSQPRPRRP